jgi:hypothetical protein
MYGTLSHANLPSYFPTCASCSKEKLEEAIAVLQKEMEIKEDTIEETTARLQR